jgi:hypothetical protein
MDGIYGVDRLAGWCINFCLLLLLRRYIRYPATGRILRNQLLSLNVLASFCLYIKTIRPKHRRKQNHRASQIPFPSSLVLMFILVLLAISAATVSALCYTPDGNISNDISCSSSTSQASICCQRGYYCTKAHLCLQPSRRNASGYAFDGVYIRGTCSDETWQDPACGGNCVDGTYT